MAQPDVGPNDIVIHLLNPYKCAVCSTEFFMRSVFLEHLGEHIEKLKAGNPCNQVVCAVSLAEVPDNGITVTRDILQINDQQMFELQDPTLDYTQLTPLKTLEDAGILSLPKPQALPKILTKPKQEALVKLSQETNVTKETNKFSLLAKHPQLRIESQLGEGVLNSSEIQMDLNDPISQQSLLNLQHGPQTNLNIAELDAIVQQTLFEDGRVRGEYSIKIETPSQLTQTQESMMMDDASQVAEGVETFPNHLLHEGFGNVEEKSILGKKKKKPVCPICLNEFSNQNALERHQVVHTGEKPHRCLVCFKQFNDISSLRKHNFIHKRQHRCPICHRLYLRRSQLALHMKHHGKKRYIQFGNGFHEVKVEMSRNEHGQMVQEFSLMMLLTDKDKSVGMSHVQEDQIGEEANEKIDQTNDTLVNEAKSVLIGDAQRDGTEEAGAAESLMRKKSVIYRCGHCKKMIFTRPTLSRHLIRHTDKRPFTCEECSKSFRDKLDLVRHHMTHTKPVKCKTCSSSFSKPLYLEKHLLQGCPFKDNDARFTVLPNLRCQCNVCHKILKSKVNVLRHLRVHAFDDRVKDMATKTANTEEEGANSTTVHEIGRGDLPVRKVSGLSQNVDDHYKSLENSVGFTCLICGQEFRFKSFMKTHILVHLDLRPFKCDECGKTFFARHMLKKHQQNHTRPYKCPVCNRGFIRRYLMRDHFNKKHEAGKEDKMQDITVLEDRKLIQCDICGKTMQSYQKSLMLYHVRLHKDVRPFECQTCQKKFSSENALKKHSLNHKKPYICKVCNHGFSRRYLLMEHFKKSCSKKKITKFVADNTILEFPKEAPVAQLNLGEQFDQDSGADFSETDKPFDEASTYQYQPTIIKEVSTETGSEKYICEPCDKPFLVYENLIRHLTTFAKSTACKHCQTVFPDKHLTMAHQRSCLGIPIESQIKSRKLLPLGKKQEKVQKIMKEIKEVIETVTSKTEEHKALPMEVMNTESNASTAKVSAPMGHQVPSGTSALNVTLARTITALTEQKGKFQCPECAKTFGTPRGLKIHANSHIRLYKCESCGEDFTQLCQLRAHCVQHQEGSIDSKSLAQGESKKCVEESDVQGESAAWDSFDTNSSFDTKESMPEDNTNDCEEKVSNVKLEHKTIEVVNQRLMMTGTRGRPFSCKMCRRRFTEQCGLDTHILQIHGV